MVQYREFMADKTVYVQILVKMVFDSFNYQNMQRVITDVGVINRYGFVELDEAHISVL